MLDTSFKKLTLLKNNTIPSTTHFEQEQHQHNVLFSVKIFKMCQHSPVLQTLSFPSIILREMIITLQQKLKHNDSKTVNQ